MTEKELTELFLKRDETAIAEAAGFCGGRCRAAAKRILRDGGAAEECFSDALLKAWESIPPNKPESISAYLLKLTRNTALNRVRAQSAERRGGGSFEAALSELDSVVSGTHDPEAELQFKELASCISVFLKKLPRVQREVFTERYWHFEPIEGIAKRHDLSRTAVYTMLSRVRLKLKKYLEKEGYSI